MTFAVLGGQVNEGSVALCLLSGHVMYVNVPQTCSGSTLTPSEMQKSNKCNVRKIWNTVGALLHFLVMHCVLCPVPQYAVFHEL